MVLLYFRNHSTPTVSTMSCDSSVGRRLSPLWVIPAGFDDPAEQKWIGWRSGPSLPSSLLPKESQAGCFKDLRLVLELLVLIRLDLIYWVHKSPAGATSMGKQTGSPCSDVGRAGVQESRGVGVLGLWTLPPYPEHLSSCFMEQQGWWFQPGSSM